MPFAAQPLPPPWPDLLSRCNARRADAVRVWLALGQQMARDRCLDEPSMLVRTLSLLLRTANDEALPSAWRRICADHTARPLARLTACLGTAGRDIASTLHALVQQTQDRLDARADGSRRSPA